MERSQDQNRIIEYLRIQPISHSQIYTSQIAIPETQRGEIIRDRREALRRSLIEQGSNLIPLIVRPTEAYSNEEEYEVVCGADWCIVAKELGIEQMWAWVFEMTDEEVAAAQTEMELLAPQPTQTTAQLETLLQQFELSFQKKVESLTKQIEHSIKKNEDLLKKQVKALTEQKLEGDKIAQIRIVIAEIEETFNKKVDNLAKKIERSGSNIPPTSAAMDEMNLEGALILLDEFDKLLSIKLEFTVETINQFVEEAITGLESDLKNQIARLRHQLGATTPNSGIPPETKPKTKSKTQPKKPFLPQLPPLQSPAEDYDSLSLRRLKAIGKERKLRGYARMKRPEILAALKQIDGK
jgi:hypothetical protein